MAKDSFQKKLWECEKCGKKHSKLMVKFHYCGGEKVDIEDYWTPCCASEAKFLGTDDERGKYWDYEWDN